MGSHYREYFNEELERDLYEFLRSALVQTKSGVALFIPTTGKIREIVSALARLTLIPRDAEMPSWLDRTDDASNLVACRNGILNLETRKLLPHNPGFFTTTCLPIEFDPKAPEPARWLQFLEELWPGVTVPAEELTLQEIFGYLVTPDTRQQKIFLIFGPKRAGKGTISFVLEELIGKESVVYPTLSSMSGEFGRWPLIDKKLAIIADARLGSKTDTQQVAEQLLSISGGDPQTINRKNQPFWNGRLGVRFLITTNELPAIRDASGTIASRFVALKLERSFFGSEDVDLKAKLTLELAGILNWALDGLDRLRKRGYFKMPPSSLEAIRELEDLASPVGAFVRDWCDVSPVHSENVKDLYRAYSMGR